MQRRIQRCVLLLSIVLPLGVGGLAAQENSELRAMLGDLAQLIGAEGPGASSFVEEFVEPELLERVGREAAIKHLQSIVRDLDGLEIDTLFAKEGRVSLVLIGPNRREGVEGRLRMGEGPPKLTDLWILGSEHLDSAIPRDPKERPQQPRPVEAITWDKLEARLAEEAAAGFEGVILVARAGQVVCERAYGWANRDKKIALTPDTIFAVGSVPIDFTNAGILLLMDAGVIRGDEVLTDFFEGVPADKQSISVTQLMTGASGLQNFHDLPGDRDPDHSWIDREEALRRILSSELLFAPGTGREHSHSAWGLLAAMIEIRSGETYREFAQANLFDPAGMVDTGFNGDAIAEERLALGYNGLTDGELNAPPYWGPTSWLVMGSGGMVSSVRDMNRWFQALRSGKILGERALGKYWSAPGSLLEAGDSYGYEVCYSEGLNSRFLLMGNSVGVDQRAVFKGLARRLLEMVQTE